MYTHSIHTVCVTHEAKKSTTKQYAYAKQSKQTENYIRKLHPKIELNLPR